MTQENLASAFNILSTSQPLELGGSVKGVETPKSGWNGKYPPELKGSMKGKAVFVIGGGEVYQEMYAPAFAHLGVQVYLYDPNPVATNHNEIKLNSLEEAPKDIPAYILSPHHLHYSQMQQMREQNRSFACEKTICLPNQVEPLCAEMAEYNKPTYFTDFNHMMGRGLVALASGISMPFMDEGAIEVSDHSGRISEALRNHQPLIKGKIVSVSGSYLQGGSNFAATVPDGWQHNRAEGGGQLPGLGARLFNLCQLSGLSSATVENAHLMVRADMPGTYKDVVDTNQAENWANVTGKMGDAPFDFTVGKYAAADKQELILTYDNGEKLVLLWQPPNRKNTVEWRGQDDKVIGTLRTEVDPYLCNILESLNHFENGQGHLYLKEQAQSVKSVGQAADIYLRKLNAHQSSDVSLTQEQHDLNPAVRYAVQ